MLVGPFHWKCPFFTMSITFFKVSIVHVPFGCRQGILLSFFALFICALGAGKMFFAG